jgi:exopolysaccharide biosynthesis polyprenyl glycosylphosphotransferase
LSVDTEMTAPAVMEARAMDGGLFEGRFERLGQRQLVHPEGHTPSAILEGNNAGLEVESRDRRYRRSLAAADLLATALALLVTIALLGDGGLRAASLVVLPLVVGLAKLHGLYDRDELLIRKTTMDEAPQIFQLATLCTLIFWLAHGSIIEGGLATSQVAVLWAGMFCFGVIGRRAARTLARRATAAERCLFVGDARSYDRLAAKLQSPQLKVDLVGRMNLQRIGRKGERATHVAELRELIAWTRTHRLIIEPQALPPEEMLDFVRAAKSAGVRVSLVPRVLDVVGSSIVFDELDGVTLLGVRRFGLTRSSALVKRAFDLVGCAIILLTAAPAMALIALLIKLDSRGPVLFRQTRVGRDGKFFRICKFRTMVTDAEERKAELRVANEAGDGLFKIADDPRVTRVGRFLRKTSLDEMPQLFNVLAGDMSLVGPRPLVTDEDAQIKGWDRRRLHLTPGMTGHWQIAGSARVPMHEMVKIDYLYVAGWSLWSDLKLLARTVPYVLARRGM